jgi:hypothetical protein
MKRLPMAPSVAWTTILLGGSAAVVRTWSPLASLILVGAVTVVVITVAIVALAAALGRDGRQQRNAVAVLDRLLPAGSSGKAGEEPDAKTRPRRRRRT